MSLHLAFALFPTCPLSIPMSSVEGQTSTLLIRLVTRRLSLEVAGATWWRWLWLGRQGLACARVERWLGLLLSYKPSPRAHLWQVSSSTVWLQAKFSSKIWCCTQDNVGILPPCLCFQPQDPVGSSSSARAPAWGCSGPSSAALAARGLWLCASVFRAAESPVPQRHIILRSGW